MRYLARVRVALLVLLISLGCSEPDPALPELAAPQPEGPPEATEAAAPAWPRSPADLPADVSRCVDDYRELARGGLPAQGSGEAFSTWYSDAFQTWTDRYNVVRGRCDEVFAALEQTSGPAQVMLAAQSYMHERLSEEATPLGEEPQMFLMARYWALGAACTYQACARGPSAEWTALCDRRARELPACPPIPEDDAAP